MGRKERSQVRKSTFCLSREILICEKALYFRHFKENSVLKLNRSLFGLMLERMRNPGLILIEVNTFHHISLRDLMLRLIDIKASVSPFLFLAVDLPPPPLFQDSVEKNIIPQVSIHSVLAKYDGRTTQVSVTYVNLRITYTTPNRNQLVNYDASNVSTCLNILSFISSALPRMSSWKKRTPLSSTSHSGD